jgi:hypothetical protein
MAYGGHFHGQAGKTAMDLMVIGAGVFFLR